MDRLVPEAGGASDGASTGSDGSGVSSSGGGNLLQVCRSVGQLDKCSNGAIAGWAELWSVGVSCAWAFFGPGDTSAGTMVLEPDGTVNLVETTIGTWSGTASSYDVVLDSADGGGSTVHCVDAFSADGGVGTDCTTEPCSAPLICCPTVNECAPAVHEICTSGVWVSCTRASDCGDGGVCCVVPALENGVGSVCRTATCSAGDQGPACNVRDGDAGAADCPGPAARCFGIANAPASLGVCRAN